jgi:hypothetical protein
MEMISKIGFRFIKAMFDFDLIRYLNPNQNPMPSKTEVLAPILEGVKEVLSQSDDTLIRNYRKQNPDEASFALQEAKIPMKELKDIFRLINAEALEFLPDKKLHIFISGMTTIFGIIRRLHEYSISPNRTIENAQRELSGAYNEGVSDGLYKYMDMVWPLITDSLTLMNASRDTGQVEITTIRDNLKFSNDVKGQLVDIVKAAKDELVKKGISKHAKIFSTQAAEHKKNAGKWRTASISLVVVNLAAIVGFYFLVLCSDKENRIVVSISSLLVVSLISYMIVLCVKSYFAEKHNETINNHKANCLDSYNTFVEGANEDVRAAVLQFTTQTIFSQFNPGFLNKDSVQSPSPILELLRTVNTKT